MRAFRTLLLSALAFAAFGVTACGSDNNTSTDAGTTEPLDLEKYFGLQVGRCFEYTTFDFKQASPDFGMAVTKTATKNGYTLYYVNYLKQGTALMEDWFSIDNTKGELLLHRRAFLDGKTFLYAPPLTYAKAPVSTGDHFEATTAAEVYDGAGNPVAELTGNHTMRVDAFAAAALKVPAIDNPVDAVRLTFTETPARGPSAGPEVRTFIPGTGAVDAIDGWLTIENNFTADDNHANTIYKLQAVRDLGTTVGDITTRCGSGE